MTSASTPLQEPPRRARDLAVVLGFVLITALPFLGQAFNIDEPFFLAVGRHILKDPRRPFDFYFNWYGRKEFYALINNTPPLFHYALALALKITGGGEWAMRAFFLPFDLASACFLYLLAARFLKRPLLPTLILLSTPTYLIDMPHLMPEKIMALFSFACLYGLVRGIDDEKPLWYWISACSLALALLSKYAALFLILPATGYCLERGVKFKRILAYILVSFSGILLYFLYDHWTHHAAIRAATSVFAALSALKSPVLLPSYKARAFLSFLGGLGIAPTLWPCLFFWRKPKTAFFLVALSAFLFLPYFDALSVSQHVRFLDRLLGFVFSALALGALWELFSSREIRGWPLWASWILSAALVQIVLYWSMVARLFLFILPPLVFAMAEKLESALDFKKLRALALASLALTLTLSLSLERVDAAYADSQRRLSQWVQSRYMEKGRAVWFTGHWGLQYYMEKIGAREAGESSQKIRSGDIFIYPSLNANLVFPDVRVVRLRLIETIKIQNPIPLRLMEPQNGLGQAGFYSSLWGFLPYDFEREPIDEFFITQVRPQRHSQRRSDTLSLRSKGTQVRPQRHSQRRSDTLSLRSKGTQAR